MDDLMKWLAAAFPVWVLLLWLSLRDLSKWTEGGWLMPALMVLISFFSGLGWIGDWQQRKRNKRTWGEIQRLIPWYAFGGIK